ncbi:MAG: hypothetical protein DCC71_18355 [Proteobacteria bacterium]|nr:MAG: hypothetical protein DCC71_18355 [Pseudomonadota bacterium]
MLLGFAPRSAAARRLLTALGAAALLAACSREERAASDPARTQERRPGSQPQVTASLQRDLAAERSRADGAGRVAMDPLPAPPRIRELQRFRFVYEAGPLGIAEGGALFFQASPFFGWSKIQTSAPDIAGYTTFRTTAAGVTLEEGRADNPYLLPIVVRGRALREGEQIEVVYGAGSRGAQVDRFAERGERFWFHVDGDGDGVRGTIADSPSIDVLPGPPGMLVLHLPATARPGETVALTAALLDDAGDRTPGEAATLRFAERPAGVALPESAAFDPAAGGALRVEAPVTEPGVVRVRGSAQLADGRTLEAESNPMLVRADAPTILWADLHGHTNWSDGTGHPEDYLRYARDVAALDVAALTDHDHWGTPFFDASPERWKQTQELTERYYAPGRFVTVLGFEWTNWTYGHRHVLYFDRSGDLLSSVDAETETPQALWESLRGREAMTIAHHSAGGPVAIDWSIPPDPVLEPVTEIASAHGSSEAPDTQYPIYDAIPGNWVRDQLAKHYVFGFVGSGDGHDGHPGLAHLGSPYGGGLAGIIAESRTREAVLEALRARRTFATNGPRMLLRVSLGGRRMGEAASLADLAAAAAAHADVELVVQVVGTAPIAKVDVVHNRSVAQSYDAEGRREVMVRWAVPPLDTGDFVYVRAVQQDGGAAWSSPWFIE